MLKKKKNEQYDVFDNEEFELAQEVEENAEIVEDNIVEHEVVVVAESDNEPQLDDEQNEESVAEVIDGTLYVGTVIAKLRNGYVVLDQNRNNITWETDELHEQFEQVQFYLK